MALAKGRKPHLGIMGMTICMLLAIVPAALGFMPANAYADELRDAAEDVVLDQSPSMDRVDDAQDAQQPQAPSAASSAESLQGSSGFSNASSSDGALETDSRDDGQDNVGVGQGGQEDEQLGDGEPESAETPGTQPVGVSTPESSASDSSDVAASSQGVGAYDEDGARNPDAAGAIQGSAGEAEAEDDVVAKLTAQRGSDAQGVTGETAARGADSQPSVEQSSGMPAQRTVATSGVTSTDDAPGAGSLPSRFDLREEGVVSPVKLQSPWGTCWAFAVSSASESSILSDLGLTFEDIYLELSPRHLAWFAGTALPDAETMNSLATHVAYASQSTEGVTVLPVISNPYGSPLENGGFSFMAACLFSSGMGPVYLYQVPYRNEEGMAVYTEDGSVGQLKYNQTVDEFLAQHPGQQYHAFVVEGPDGNVNMYVVMTAEATQELIDQGVLSHYAIAPAFDEDGYPITELSPNAPIYTWGVSEDERFMRAYELLEYRVLPQPTGGYEGDDYRYNEEATRAIKQELMAGRGVTVSIYDDSLSTSGGRGKFTNAQTWSQYTVNWSDVGKIYGSGHAVCIVGWDDNWGVENFLSGTVIADDGTKVSRTPPGPGAWIVKNSYGADGRGFPNEGDIGYVDPKTGKHTGYFYLSYYDMSITWPASFVYDVSGHISNYINQYDLMPAPVVHTEKFTEETACANVFTAAADQIIHSLSVETELPNTHVKLQLWRLRDNATSPVDGDLLATVESDFTWGGFYRLKLDEPCLVKAGERFSIVGLLTTVASDGTVTYHVPVHRDVNEQSLKKYGAAITSYAKGVVNAGESFLLIDGLWCDWKDLIDSWKQNGKLVWYYDYDNFSLKAYADVFEIWPAPAPSPTPTPEPAPAPEPVPACKPMPASESLRAPQPMVAAYTVPDQLPDTGDALPWAPLCFVAVMSTTLLVISAWRMCRAEDRV